MMSLMKRILPILLLAALVFAANPQTTNIKDAICGYMIVSRSLFVIVVGIFLLAGLAFLAAGAFIYLKKGDKKFGITLMIIGVAMPVIAFATYFLTPVLVGMLTGQSVNC